jgi:polyisoprenoid-binding protein YceI
MEGNGMKCLLIAWLIFPSLAWLVACENPADRVPKALVTSAATPPDTSAATAEVPLIVSPENSKIDFTGSKVTGSESGWFEKFIGTIELSEANPAKSRVSVEIEMKSVVTKSKGLDEHLKTADFFEVAKYPKASFVSTEIKPSNTATATYTVTGTLELRGVKKTISFPATIKVTAEAVTVDSEFAINRKDFGINYAGRTDDLIRNEVVLKLTVKAPRRK